MKMNCRVLFTGETTVGSTHHRKPPIFQNSSQTEEPEVVE